MPEGDPRGTGSAMRELPMQANSRSLLYLWAMVAAYFCLNALTQHLVSGTADLDQAEQLILSQAFQPGYNAQPPLYTYLAGLVFSLTGHGLGPLAGVKAALLSVFVGAMIALGAAFGFTRRQHLIAVAGLVFVPQFIWESQRDLTHSVLATALAACTLLQVVRTRGRPSLGNYLALGALVGLGLLSKYNYAIFLLALVAAMASVPRYRAVLGDGRFLATILVMAIIVAPHVFWLVDNHALAGGGIERPPGGRGDILSGLGVAAVAALAFLTPLWLFSFILGFGFRREEGGGSDPADGRLLLNLLGLVAVCVVLFVALANAQQVKDRWYQPLLFFVPLLVAYHSRPSPRGFRIFMSLAALFAVLVSFALPARTLLAEKLNKYSRPNMPYPGLIRSISPGAEAPLFVLAETKLLGGNARLAFPDAGVLAPDFNVKIGRIAGKGLVICETRHCDAGEFRDWLRRDQAIDARALQFRAAEMPFNYAPAKKMTIYWAEVTAPAPSRPDAAPH